MNNPQQEIFLHYKGAIFYNTIGELIGELKEKMFEQKIKQAVYKKVLMVMIEALENVFKYHEFFEKEKEILNTYLPEITIKKLNDFFSISVSNPVRIVDVDVLKKKLEGINKLDKPGIKQVYKEIITNGEFSEKGGAGLGIVEMAKITDSKLDFSFTRINDDFVYYSLTLKIDYPY